MLVQKPRLSAGIAAVMLLGVVACGEGSGNIVSQTRDVGSFDRIDVSDAINLVVTVDGDAEPSVVVSYDDNIIDRLVTAVDGSTLVVEFDGSVRISGKGRSVEVVTQSLVALSTSGASDVVVTGEAASLFLEASGASDVDATSLTVGDIVVDVSGASDVEIRATGSVTGEASGASDVVVHGDPVEVDVDTSGNSSVRSG